MIGQITPRVQLLLQHELVAARFASGDRVGGFLTGDHLAGGDPAGGGSNAGTTLEKKGMALNGRMQVLPFNHHFVPSA